MTGLFAAIYLYQRKQWTWGSVLLSCGLGVKMNVLLVLPAVAVIIYQAGGPMMLLMQTSWMAQVQVGLTYILGFAISQSTNSNVAYGCHAIFEEERQGLFLSSI